MSIIIYRIFNVADGLVVLTTLWGTHLNPFRWRVQTGPGGLLCLVHAARLKFFSLPCSSRVGCLRTAAKWSHKSFPSELHLTDIGYPATLLYSPEQTLLVIMVLTAHFLSLIRMLLVSCPRLLDHHLAW